MKIDGVVVLYNPEDSIYENILSSQKVLSKLFVIDNSTSPNIKIVEQLKKLNNVEYVSLNGNQGIGKALKVGLELAVEDGADYCLTIDQDSVFPSESIDKIETYFGVIQEKLKQLVDSSKQNVFPEIDIWALYACTPLKFSPRCSA